MILDATNAFKIGSPAFKNRTGTNLTFASRFEQFRRPRTERLHE